MPTEKEFKVNKYITLKLEGGKTNIYVKDQLFNQCKFLLLDIYVDKFSSFDEIESIDEAAEKLDRSLERRDIAVQKIPPETEFWGHCSNMQVWTEHQYDTRLLHRTIAFPLLKKLSDIGDNKAQVAFKEEIIRRIKSGYVNVVKFLISMKYLRYLSNEEIKLIFLDSNTRLKENILNASKIEKTLKTISLPILETLIQLGDKYAREMLYDIIFNKIKDRKPSEIHVILSDQYLAYFKKSELKNLFLKKNHDLKSVIDIMLKIKSEEKHAFELLNKLMLMGDPNAKDKLKLEIIKRLNTKDINYFIFFLEKDYFKDFSESEYESLLLNSELDIIRNYVEKIDEKGWPGQYGKEIHNRLINSLTSFQKIKLHQYPFNELIHKLIAWINEISINEFALAICYNVLDFLPNKHFKSLILDKDLGIIDKLLKLYDSRRNNDALDALCKIGNKSPETYSVYIEKCYKESDYKKALTLCSLSYLRAESVKVIVDNPNSKLVEIIVECFRSNDNSLKESVTWIFSVHHTITSYLINKIQNYFSETEKIDLLYYIFSHGLIWDLKEKEIDDLFNQIDSKIIGNLPNILFERYITNLKRNNFDIKLIFQNHFLSTFKRIFEITFPLANENFKKDLQKLLEYKQPVLLLYLIYKDFLDFLSLDEKTRLLTEYEFKVLIKAFNQTFENTNFFEGLDYNSVWSSFMNLGEFGVKFLIQILSSDVNWDIIEGLEYYINENFELFKEEIIKSFISLNYPEIKQLFNLEALAKLDKEDVQKIINHPHSNFYDKLNSAIEEEHPSWYIENILKYTGKEGIYLFFKYINQPEIYEVDLKILKELGSDIIEPFINEVILNEHNYKYYGDYLLDNLYKIFLELLDKEQLQKLFKENNYELVQKIVNKKNTDPYFFFLLYKRLDKDLVLQIHNRLSENMKKKIINIFSEFFVESEDQIEQNRLLEILTSTGDKSKVTKFVEILANWKENNLLKELAKRIENTEIKDTQKLTETIGETYILAFKEDKYKGYNWSGLNPEKYHISWILEKLNDIFRGTIYGFYSSDHKSWVNNLISFFEMVNSLGYKISEMIENSLASDYEFDRKRISQYDLDKAWNFVYNKHEQYFGLAFESLVKVHHNRQKVEIGRGYKRDIYEFNLNLESLLKGLKLKHRYDRDLAISYLQRHFIEYRNLSKKEIFSSLNSPAREKIEETLLGVLADKIGKERRWAAEDLSSLDEKYKGKSHVEIIIGMEKSRREDCIDILVKNLNYYTKGKEKLDLVKDLMLIDSEKVFNGLKSQSFSIGLHSGRYNFQSTQEQRNIDLHIKNIIDNFIANKRKEKKKDSAVKLVEGVNLIYSKESMIKRHGLIIAFRLESTVQHESSTLQTYFGTNFFGNIYSFFKFELKTSRERIIQEKGQFELSLNGNVSFNKSIAFSKDGRYIARGGGLEWNILVWDLTDNKIKTTLIGHKDIVNIVIISPENKYIISGAGSYETHTGQSKDNSIKIWSLNTGNLYRSLNGHTKKISALAISLNSKYLISGSDDTTIKLWNFESGKLIQSFTEHEHRVTSIAITPDSNYFFSSSLVGFLKMWSLTEKKFLKNLIGHKGYINSLSISDDGLYIVSASNDKTVKLWNTKTGKKLGGILHDNAVIYSSFLSGTHNFLTKDSSGDVFIWDFETIIRPI